MESRDCRRMTMKLTRDKGSRTCETDDANTGQDRSRWTNTGVDTRVVNVFFFFFLFCISAFAFALAHGHEEQSKQGLGGRQMLPESLPNVFFLLFSLILMFARDSPRENRKKNRKKKKKRIKRKENVGKHSIPHPH